MTDEVPRFHMTAWKTESAALALSLGVENRLRRPEYFARRTGTVSNKLACKLE